jgi:hypothetical protein
MEHQHVRVAVGFNRLTDHQIEEIVNGVITHMTGNKAFPAPPVDLTALHAEAADFTAAIAAAAQGGPHATSEKNKKRKALIAQLRKLALYVEASSGDDVTTVLSSGLQPVFHSHTQKELEKPIISAIDSRNSGELRVKVKAVRTAKSYEVHHAPVGTGGTPGAWQTLGGFTNSRSIVIKGLVPGTNYAVQVRAVGGTKGYSDWSDPVSHMCI